MTAAERHHRRPVALLIPADINHKRPVSVLSAFTLANDRNAPLFTNMSLTSPFLLFFVFLICFSSCQHCTCVCLDVGMCVVFLNPSSVTSIGFYCTQVAMFKRQMVVSPLVQVKSYKEMKTSLRCRQHLCRRFCPFPHDLTCISSSVSFASSFTKNIDFFFFRQTDV